MVFRFPAVLLLCAATLVAAAEPPPLGPRQRGEDLDALVSAIESGYAWLGDGRAAWHRTRDMLRHRAMKAAGRDEFVAVLERALLTLRDERVTLSERSRQGPRRMPAEVDAWARFQGRQAVVEAVRPFGDADVAGLRPGDVVVSVDGVPIDRAVRDRMMGGATMTAEARDWALRQVLAGPRGGVQRLKVSRGPATMDLAIDRSAAPQANGGNGGPLAGRRLGEDRDLGFIRFKGPLEDERVGEFDAALQAVRGTRALILDLRDAGEPGDRAATLAILSRFATAPSPWQLREVPGKPRVADRVAPRGEAYRGPVVVLVDRWTAGEGEALAAGLQSVAKARLVGTRMAGLRGELREVVLPHSGITVRFPAERTFTPDGTPREQVKPDVEIDLASPSGGPGDPILYQALKLLAR